MKKGKGIFFLLGSLVVASVSAIVYALDDDDKRGMKKRWSELKDRFSTKKKKSNDKED